MKIKHYLIAVILCASAAVSAQSVWNAEHLAEVRNIAEPTMPQHTRP